MNDTVLSLTVDTPRDLENNIFRLKNNFREACFVSLAVRDPRLLVYPFDVEMMSYGELKTKLVFEAVGILSLPADQIDLDYQIFSKEDGRFKGVFLCAPRSIMKEYLTKIYKANLVPIEMTTSILCYMNDFLSKHSEHKKRFCIVYFYKENSAHLSVFQNGRCELLREIFYEDSQEIRGELVQSFRSVYARSSDKTPGEIYCLGVLDDKEDVIKALKQDFKLNTSADKGQEGHHQKQSKGPEFFHLNLIRNYEVSLKKRKYMLDAMKVCIGAMILVCAVSLFGVLKNQYQIRQIEKSYSASDYQYAQQLQEQLNNGSH